MVKKSTVLGLAGGGLILVIIVGLVVVPLFQPPILEEPDDPNLSTEAKIIRRVENHPIPNPWLPLVAHYFERYTLEYNDDIFDEIFRSVLDNLTNTELALFNECLYNYKMYKELLRPVIPPTYFDDPISQPFNPSLFTTELKQCNTAECIHLMGAQNAEQGIYDTSFLNPGMERWYADGGNIVLHPQINYLKYYEDPGSHIGTGWGYNSKWAPYLAVDINAVGENIDAAVSQAPQLRPGRLVELIGVNFYDVNPTVQLWKYNWFDETWEFYSTVWCWVQGDLESPLGTDWSLVRDTISFTLPYGIEDGYYAIRVINKPPEIDSTLGERFSQPTPLFRVLESQDDEYRVVIRSINCMVPTASDPGSNDEIAAYGTCDFILNDNAILTRALCENVGFNQGAYLVPSDAMSWNLHFDVNSEQGMWIDPDGLIFISIILMDDDGLSGIDREAISTALQIIISAVCAAMGVTGIGSIISALIAVGLWVYSLLNHDDLIAEDYMIFFEDELLYLTNKTYSLEQSPHYFEGTRRFGGGINTRIIEPAGHLIINYPASSSSWREPDGFQYSAGEYGDRYPGFAEWRAYFNENEESEYWVLLNIERRIDLD